MEECNWVCRFISGQVYIYMKKPCVSRKKRKNPEPPPPPIMLQNTMITCDSFCMHLQDIALFKTSFGNKRLSFPPPPSPLSCWTPRGQTGGWYPCPSQVSQAGCLLTTWRRRPWRWGRGSCPLDQSLSGTRPGRLRESSRGWACVCF